MNKYQDAYELVMVGDSTATINGEAFIDLKQWYETEGKNCSSTNKSTYTGAILYPKKQNSPKKPLRKKKKSELDTGCSEKNDSLVSKTLKVSKKRKTPETEDSDLEEYNLFKKFKQYLLNKSKNK